MPYINVGQENSGSIDLYYEDHGDSRVAKIGAARVLRRVNAKRVWTHRGLCSQQDPDIR
jgi:hypothetical protein